MNKIEVKILNPDSVFDSEKMMVCAARLTQRGHQIKSMEDFLKLYEKNYGAELVESLVSLPHPTIQKLGVINVVIVGASRRFLAQITRHQNEVKFISASLQYSDYSDNAGFLIPYEILEQGEGAVRKYLSDCMEEMKKYQEVTREVNDHDVAGYMAPQALRNVLLVSATPYQWKHMISQRTCKRNTVETRFVMLKIWQRLYALNQIFFKDAGPFCMKGKCQEKKMSCKYPIRKDMAPGEIIKEDFPLLWKEADNED